MNSIIHPLGRLVAGGVRVGKLLTTWSVLIGVLAALDTNSISDFSKVVNDKGIWIALISPEWFRTLSFSFLTIGLFGLFAYTEWKQSDAAERDAKKVSGALVDIGTTLNALNDAIGRNTEVLDKIASMLPPPVNPPHDSKGDK